MDALLRGAIVPAIAVGAWAGRLWHQYVTDVGCTLGSPANSTLMLASTVAIGLGALGIIALLVRPRAEASLATARLAHRAHAITGASLTVALIIGSLAMSERLVPHGACDAARTAELEAWRAGGPHEEDEPPPPEIEEPCCASGYKKVTDRDIIDNGQGRPY